MGFRVVALDATRFNELYGLDDAALMERGVERVTVQEKPGAPCRVSLVDCEVGETALLMGYEHHSAPTPYRSRHAIFVREGAVTAVADEDTVPELLAIRTLSVRAFDRGGWMLDAEVAEGVRLTDSIDRMFGDEAVAYLHIHNAAAGCFLASIERT